MDPLTCVSLAGAVAQFVNFGCGLISAGGQLYRDGRLEIHASAAKDAEQIQNYAVRAIGQLHDYRAKLQQGFRSDEHSLPLKEDEAELEKLCRGCDKEANALINRLEKLKVPEGSGKEVWKSIQDALLSVWSKAEIAAMKEKLLAYQKSIDSGILLSLR